MRQRIGLADVLIKNPEVIILDEPTLGIDPKGVQEFLELIIKLSKEEGHTVLLSSHHLHQIQEVCDRVGLFVSGRLIAEGSIQSLAQKAKPAVCGRDFNWYRHCRKGIGRPSSGWSNSLIASSADKRWAVRPG